MKVTAIDVSFCQTGVDYNKVKADGIDTVIIRAGFGRETYQKDAQFEEHYRKAKAAGLKVGVYWFSYAYSVAEAKKEASACLYCLNGRKLDLPVFYDLELGSQTKLGKDTLTAMAVAFCECVKVHGYSAGVYASASWFASYLNYEKLKKQYAIWLAQWRTDSPCLLATSGRTPTAEKSTALTEMLIPTLYLMLTIRAVQQQRLQRRNTPELKLCRLG